MPLSDPASAHAEAATPPHAPAARPSRAERAASTRRLNRARLLADIRTRSARDAGAIALSPTHFVQAMLPHREVYEMASGEPVTIPDGHGGTQKLLAKEYSATNRDYTLSVRAGMTQGPSHLHPRVSRGVPYGGLARLLLCDVVTVARTQKSRTIDLGDTVSAFCERVHVTPSGGEKGRLRYVLDQLQRLATCVVTFEWETVRPGRRDLKASTSSSSTATTSGAEAARQPSNASTGDRSRSRTGSGRRSARAASHSTSVRPSSSAGAPWPTTSTSGSPTA